MLIAATALLTACAGSSPPVGADTESGRGEQRAAIDHPESPKVAEQATAVALAQVGVPYRYGGQTPETGFDCSGLVHFAYLEAGRPLPRTTGSLWAATVRVPRSRLRRGDLVFFSIEGKMQHVGLYIGGDRFVHAPSSGRRVSVESLSSAFYSRALKSGGRPR